MHPINYAFSFFFLFLLSANSAVLWVSRFWNSSIKVFENNCKSVYILLFFYKHTLFSSFPICLGFVIFCWATKWQRIMAL